MNIKIDPKEYNLHRSTNLFQIGKNKYKIVINRKSRFIMKDGQKIMTKFNNIKEINPDAKLELEITSPVCSKTKQFFIENNVKLNV